MTLHDATPEAGFARAGMNTFCRLDEFGLEVTGQRLAPDHAVLACRVVESDQCAAAAVVEAHRVTP
jgi:hypothetical protein